MSESVASSSSESTVTRIQTSFFADLSYIDSSKKPNPPPDLRIETSFVSKNPPQPSPKNGKSVTFAEPEVVEKPIPPPREIDRIQTCPPEDSSTEPETEIEPPSPPLKIAEKEKPFFESPPPYPIIFQPVPLKVETTFPVHLTDPLYALTDTRSISLYETQTAEICRNNSEWLMCFEDKDGFNLTWRLVDVQRNCCSIFLPRYEFVVLTADGTKAFAAHENNVCLFQQSAEMMVTDTHGQAVGSISIQSDSSYLVRSRSGMSLIQVTESKPTWFTQERHYSFELALTPEMTVSGERSVISSGNMSGRVLYRLNFEEANQLDPLHKILCLSTLIYIQKAQFRMQYTPGENEEDLVMDKWICCCARQDSFTQQMRD